MNTLQRNQEYRLVVVMPNSKVHVLYLNEYLRYKEMSTLLTQKSYVLTAKFIFVLSMNTGDTKHELCC